MKSWTFTVESRPIDVPELWHVEGELTRDAFTWRATAGDGGAVLEAPASWKGCEVRCRYRYKASEKSILSDARVLAEFADALRLKIEPVAVPDRDVRAPEVAAARTLQEKVAACLKADGLPPSLQQKVSALDHQDAAQLLADVDAWIGQLDTERTPAVAA